MDDFFSGWRKKNAKPWIDPDTQPDPTGTGFPPYMDDPSKLGINMLDDAPSPGLMAPQGLSLASSPASMMPAAPPAMGMGGAPIDVGMRSAMPAAAPMAGSVLGTPPGGAAPGAAAAGMSNPEMMAMMQGMGMLAKGMQKTGSPTVTDATHSMNLQTPVNKPNASSDMLQQILQQRNRLLGPRGRSLMSAGQ